MTPNSKFIKMQKINCNFVFPAVLLFITHILSNDFLAMGEPTKNNFGTRTTPQFHNLIELHSPCRQHLVAHSISSENLESTQGTPIKLTLQNISITPDWRNKTFMSSNRLRLDPQRNRGWICETIWIYFNPNLPLIMDSIPNITGSWIRLQTYEYFLTDPVTKQGMKSIPDSFNVILIPSSLDRKHFLIQNVPFYSTAFSRNRIFNYVPNFFVLFLPTSGNEMGSICRHTHFHTEPVLRNMNCRQFQSENPLLSGFLFFMDRTWKFNNLFGIDTKEEGTKHPFSVKEGNAFIFKTLLQHINGSLEFRRVPFLTPTVFTEMWDIDYARRQGYLAVVIDSESYNFISCHKVVNLDFKMYLQPFQFWVWFGIALSSVGITFFVHLLVKYGLKLKTTPHLVLIVFGSLVNETASIPRKLEGSNIFRTVIGPWLLVATILSNVYISLVIKGVNSPLPEERVDSFSDIFCQPEINVSADKHRAQIHLRDTLGLGWQTPNNTLILRHVLHNSICFSTLQPLFPPRTESIYKDLHYKFGHSLNYLPEFLEDMTAFSGKMKDLIYHLRDVRVRWFPKELLKRERRELPGIDAKTALGYAEHELRECGKSVFVDTTTQLNSYHKYLSEHYPSIEFYRGSNTAGILRKLVAIMFRTCGHSVLPGKFQQLLETGIYDKVKEYGRKNTLALSNNVTKQLFVRGSSMYSERPRVNKIKIEGSVQTCFIIFGVVQILAILLFGVEWGQSWMKFKKNFVGEFN